MKIRIEVPEDVHTMVAGLQDLAWDAPVGVLTGVKELSLEAEFLAAGVVRVACVVTVFPKDFVGASRASWVGGMTPAELFGRVLGAALSASLDALEAEDPPFNQASEVMYIPASDTDEALATYVSTNLGPFILKVASM